MSKKLTDRQRIEKLEELTAHAIQSLLTVTNTFTDRLVNLERQAMDIRADLAAHNIARGVLAESIDETISDMQVDIANALVLADVAIADIDELDERKVTKLSVRISGWIDRIRGAWSELRLRIGIVVGGL